MPHKLVNTENYVLCHIDIFVYLIWAALLAMIWYPSHRIEYVEQFIINTPPLSLTNYKIKKQEGKQEKKWFGGHTWFFPVNIEYPNLILQQFRKPEDLERMMMSSTREKKENKRGIKTLVVRFYYKFTISTDNNVF